MMAPLDGIRVLDATRSLTGPLCTMMLADMGAQVVKIEVPLVGDDTRYWGPPFVEDAGPTFLAYNRNKKSVAIDLRTDEGRDRFLQLARTSDVVVENFRPGTMDRFGLSYEEVRAVKDDIIYCSISGYGQDGPDAERPAMDLLVQARSGLMSLTGPIDGGAFKAAAPVADVTAGLIASSTILASLLERKTSGQGRRIDVSMLDAMCILLGQPIAAHGMSGATPARWGNEHALMAPYQSFRTAEREIVIAVTNDKSWAQMCKIPDFADLAQDTVLATARGRSEQRHELNGELAKRMKEKGHEYWLARFEEVGVPVELVNTIPDLVGNDELFKRRALLTTEYPAGSGNLYTMPGMPWRDVAAEKETISPPTLGQHTEDVIGQL